jgi:hypothetical protein
MGDPLTGWDNEAEDAGIVVNHPSLDLTVIVERRWAPSAEALPLALPAPDNRVDLPNGMEE